ncbi:MAG: peptidoglycan-binding protein [Clostridia bacterium]|nr:peptidoglycan-binding protein [Clostridia bacterium]
MKRPIKTLLALLLTVSMLLMIALPSFALSPSVATSAEYTAGPYYANLLNVELTGNMREDIMAVAHSQVGYMEGSYSSQVAGTAEGHNNFTEYNRFANMAGGWCGMFVSWCAAMAGVPSSIVKPSTSAKPYYYSGYGFNFVGDNPLAGSDFKGYYDLAVKGGGYVPQAGDLIFFGYYNAKNVYSLGLSTYKHVGLVDYTELFYDAYGNVNKMIVHTVEGNVSDKVKEKKYTVTATSSGYCYADTYIAAFGIPAYETTGEGSGACYDIGAYGGSLLKVNQSSGDAVIKMQLALKILSLTNTSITPPTVNGTFDTATYNALKQYQKLKGLDVDGCCGPASWSSLRSAMAAATAAIKSNFIVENGTLLLYKGHCTAASIPAECTALAPYSFYGADNLKMLTVERTLKTVNANVFSSCSALSNVTYLGTAQVFDGLTVNATGNAPFVGAQKIYNPKKYAITFSVNGKNTVVSCVEGSLPVFTGSTDVTSSELLYYFIGWDKPIVAATENATYTAQYYTLPNNTVLLTGGSSQKTFSGSVLTFDLYLKNSSSVSSFCFNLDYSLSLSELSFISFRPAVSGVSCDSSLEGMLKMTYSGASLPEGDLKLGSVQFDVSEDLAFNEERICELLMVFMATDGYIRHKAADGREYQLPLSCDLVSVPIHDRYLNDFSGDGQLSISDVSELLNILSGNSTSDQNTKGFSISDVSALLNLLAMS